MCILQHLKKRHIQLLQLKRRRHMKGQTNKIIELFVKSKVFNKTHKINKRDVSPNRIIKTRSNKRRNSTNIAMNTNKKLRSR